MTEVLPVNAAAIEKAVALLRAGGIVALPTETVYGLAADATNGLAVAKVFAAKARPSFNPLICHVASFDMARMLGDFDPVSEQLARHFWPGPLTLVVPVRQPSLVHPLVTAGLATLALRMPRGIAREIITLLGHPLAAPSANSSGRISATSAKAVTEDLGDAVPLVLDGGACVVGLESTIVKVDGGKVWLLRPGGIAAEEIEAAAGMKLLRAGPQGTVEAPGMLASHYAPDPPLRLNAQDVQKGEALLAFGSRRAKGASAAVKMLNLSAAGDLNEAASNLFSHMSALDRCGAAMIAVEPVPVHGLGEAINDRLSRAAAPRGQ